MIAELVLSLLVSTPADDLDLALAQRAAGALTPEAAVTPAERLALLVGSNDDAGFEPPWASALRLEIVGDPVPHFDVLEDWLLRRVTSERDDDERLHIVAALLQSVVGAEPDGAIAVTLQRLTKWPWSRRDRALVAYQLLLPSMKPALGAEFVTTTYGASGDDFDRVGLGMVEPLSTRSPDHLARFVARLDAHPEIHRSPRVEELRAIHEARRTVVIDENDPVQVLQRLARLPDKLLNAPATLNPDDRRRFELFTRSPERFSGGLAELLDAIDPHRLDNLGDATRADSLLALARVHLAQRDVRRALLRLIDRLARPPQRSETRGHRRFIADHAHKMFGRACDIELARVLIDTLEWPDLDSYLVQNRSNWLHFSCLAEPEVRERLLSLAKRRLPHLEDGGWFVDLARAAEKHSSAPPP